MRKNLEAQVQIWRNEYNFYWRERIKEKENQKMDSENGFRIAEGKCRKPMEKG